MLLGGSKAVLLKSTDDTSSLDPRIVSNMYPCGRKTILFTLVILSSINKEVERTLTELSSFFPRTCGNERC